MSPILLTNMRHDARTWKTETEAAQWAAENIPGDDWRTDSRGLGDGWRVTHKSIDSTQWVASAKVVLDRLAWNHAHVLVVVVAPGRFDMSVQGRLNHNDKDGGYEVACAPSTAWIKSIASVHDVKMESGRIAIVLRGGA